ncbi:MAG TPA: 50S ribosomal protein L35 [Myxococcota bacterium]|jgi:large subunit ribosomal protein L35
MPKMKSHRGAAKRVKRTGTGKFVRSQVNKNHILTKKDSKRKRQLRDRVVVSRVDQKRLERLLPG